MAKTKV